MNGSVVHLILGTMSVGIGWTLTGVVELQLLVLGTIEVSGRTDNIELGVQLPSQGQNAGDDIAVFLRIHKLPVGLVHRHVTRGQFKGDHSFRVRFGHADTLHGVPGGCAFGFWKNEGRNCRETERGRDAMGKEYSQRNCAHVLSGYHRSCQ